jgi:hypothetical protein
MPAQTILGIDANLWAITADLRLFPFKNGIFVGIAAGHQRLAAGTTTVYTGPVGITAETWFCNPRVGLLATWSSGVTFGIDAGVQLPISATFSSNLPMQLPIAQDVTDVAHLLGKRVLPTIDLLRLGFMI